MDKIPLIFEMFVMKIPLDLFVILLDYSLVYHFKEKKKTILFYYSEIEYYFEYSSGLHIFALIELQIYFI